MTHTCDFLVIGSGAAGLQFARFAADYGRVTIITKDTIQESNTWYAQGGIAGVLSPHDSPQEHFDDTVSAGRGLCNEQAVRILVQEGPLRIKELSELGVSFSTSTRSRAYNHFDLVKEGGHTKARVAHVKDYTGREIEKALVEAVRAHPAITVYEHHYAVDLLTDRHITPRTASNTCHGAYVYDTRRNEVRVIRARITCIASGSLGNTYLHTTNPAIATGDGIAMAYRAGAPCANMEFVQFHPTTLYHSEGDSFLISEALRGFGAELKDRKGNAFMSRYHPMGSLAPRDVVSRAIDQEMKKAGDACVYLDIRHIEAEKTRKNFPAIYEKCHELGIDITGELIPVVPAAHYICGGIVVNFSGRTAIERLYACGESACTGIHGANRLASNSLLEALVFGRRAALDAAASLKNVSLIDTHTIDIPNAFAHSSTGEPVLLWHNMQEIKSTMWNYVGIVRSNYKLKRALTRINILQKEIEHLYETTKLEAPLLALRNSVTTARLVILSALRRRESRGAHYNLDYPKTNDRYWKKDTIIKRPCYL